MIATLTAFDARFTDQDTWRRLTIPCTGKAALDFTGRKLFVATQSFGPNCCATLTLWARKADGFILSWTEFRDGMIMPQATTLVSLSDVMDLLEDICNSLDGEEITFEISSLASPDALMRFIAEVQQRTNFAHAFSSITSETLSFCDDRLAEVKAAS